MAGGRPVPVNGSSRPVDQAVHLLWGLHHRLALRQPKLGEMIALRREAAELLPRTSVDEATFQAMLESTGWESRYVPGAVVANRGPGTMRDFVKQRRQIHTGHLWLLHREGYTVPSLHIVLLAREFLGEVLGGASRRTPRSAFGTAAAVGMELWARLLARWDYLRGREEHVWDMVASTKDPTHRTDGLGARDGEQLES
jgi:poly-beta-1,6-N-acetyl-D-glucosamine synthase